MANRMKLFIALPVMEEPKTLFFDSLVKFFAQARFGFVFRQIVGVSVGPGLARDHAVHEFLKTDCTDLLFVDHDIGFKAADVERLVSHDVDVVGGVYPLKQKGKPVLAYAPINGGPSNEHGLVECGGIGTGFLRIRREVFEKLRAATPELSFVNEAKEVEHDYFPVGVSDGLYIGEDLFFCKNWRKAGGKVYADLGVRLTHQGNWTFRCEPESATNETNER